MDPVSHNNLVQSSISSPVRRSTIPHIYDEHHFEGINPIDSSIIDEEFEENVDWKSNICSPSYERQRMRLFRDTWSILESKRNTEAGEEERFTFDRIVRMVQRTFKAKLVVFTLVGPTEVTVIAKAGTDMDAVKRQQAFCGMTIEELAPPLFIIRDAANDEKFKNHPFVVNEPFVRFYCGAPIYMHGYKIGTLSMADNHPRPDFGESEQLQLQEFAGIISDILMEQRKKVMSIESDYAKITVGLFSHLKKPLLQVEEAFVDAHAAFLDSKADSNVLAALVDPCIMSSTPIKIDGEKKSDVTSTCTCTHSNVDNPISESDWKSEAFGAAVIRLTESIDYLNVIIENCLQLSLSLFNYLSPHEASDLVPLIAVPRMVEDLIASVTRDKLPKGMKGPIEVILESSSSFPTDEADLSTVTLVSINLSMLWMILYSILSCECKCKGSRLRVIMSLFPADPNFSPMFLADPENKRSVNAVLTMRFIFDPVIELDHHLLAAGVDVKDVMEAATSALKFSNSSSSASSSSSSSSSSIIHCEMDHALEYLLKSFGGRVATFDPQTLVQERRRSSHIPNYGSLDSKQTRSLPGRSTSRSQSLSGKVIRIEIPCEVKVKPATMLTTDSGSDAGMRSCPKTPSHDHQQFSPTDMDCGFHQEDHQSSSPSLFASGRSPETNSFPLARWIVSRASKANLRLGKYFLTNDMVDDGGHLNPPVSALPKSDDVQTSTYKEHHSPAVNLELTLLAQQNTSKTSNLTAQLLSPELSPKPQKVTNGIGDSKKAALTVKNHVSSTSGKWFSWLPSLPRALLISLLGLSSESANRLSGEHVVSESKKKPQQCTSIKSGKVIPSMENLSESFCETASAFDTQQEPPTMHIDSYSNHISDSHVLQNRFQHERFETHCFDPLES